MYNQYYFLPSIASSLNLSNQNHENTVYPSSIEPNFESENVQLMINSYNKVIG